MESKKNYQIELCKKCWHIHLTRTQIKCFWLGDNMKTPYKPNEIIDFKSKTCNHFKNEKDAKKSGGHGGSRDWCKRDTERSNRKWFHSIGYYGQS